MDEEEKIKRTLFKKAMGYCTKEEVVEYTRDDQGSEVVAKRKVSKKHIPPDTTALRLLVEHFYSQTFKDVEKMSDEELKKEREKIIELLKEEERNAIKANREDCEM